MHHILIADGHSAEGLTLFGIQNSRGLRFHPKFTVLPSADSHHYEDGGTNRDTRYPG
jgi:hypothetical protein